MSEYPMWQQERALLNQRIEALRQQQVCSSCYDLATGALFRHQSVIYEDHAFKVVLELYPRMLGHTIVLYKPHYEDITELSDAESGRLFQFCTHVAKAIKGGLGAEKVYVNTMCDGELNHVHIQLFPRYPGDPTGSTRFVAPRGPILDGESCARRIQTALAALD